MEKPVLKPCPFCGGEAEEGTEWGLFVVRCKKCLAKCEGGDFDLMEEVVSAWNRRAGEEARDGK